MLQRQLLCGRTAVLIGASADASSGSSACITTKSPKPFVVFISPSLCSRTVQQFDSSCFAAREKAHRLAIDDQHLAEVGCDVRFDAIDLQLHCCTLLDSMRPLRTNVVRGPSGCSSIFKTTSDDAEEQANCHA